MARLPKWSPEKERHWLPLPAYLNALSGDGVHVITVNDYLARRDMEWMAPLFIGLNLTIGCIQNDMKQ